jgi:hypothetical protein
MLLRIRELVRAGRYVVTLHASEEMESDGLTLYDMEHCILVGRVVRRQRDRATGERKFLVHGDALNGIQVVVVAKIGPTGKLVVITVYAV